MIEPPDVLEGEVVTPAVRAHISIASRHRSSGEAAGDTPSQRPPDESRNTSERS